MLDYTQLAALAAVVREGSFERAARTLHVTTSAVSQRIKALEERTGAVLVVRGQPCRPTAVGRRLCLHAEQVKLLEQGLRADMPVLAGHGDAGRGTLRLAVNADSLATWFMQALAAHAAQDDTLLDIVLDDQDHTAQALRSGDVLAAVTSLAAPVQGCCSIALGSLRYVATASPDFVRRHFEGGVDARTLSAAPSLRFNQKDQLQAVWMRRVCRRVVSAPSHWLPSSQAFVDAALAGLGWGLNPQVLVRRFIDEGRLVELLPGRPVDVPLYWQVTRLAAPAVAGLTAAVVASANAALLPPPGRRRPAALVHGSLAPSHRR